MLKTVRLLALAFAFLFTGCAAQEPVPTPAPALISAEQPGQPEQQDSPALASAALVTWTPLASEFASFKLNSPRNVRYGVDTRWVFKALPAGVYTCGNEIFGDPAVGVAKSCSGSPVKWGALAQEWGSFTLKAATLVRYGVDTRWVVQTLAAGVYPCTNAQFARDPAYGVTKRCEAAIPVPVALPAPVTPPPPPPPPIVFSGPLVITQGGTYTGNWESTNENVPAVEIRTSEPVTITGSRLRGVGHWGLIEGWHARLSVRDTSFLGQRTGLIGSGVPRALSLGQPYSLSIERSTLSNTGGIYVDGFYGDPLAGETITVRYNRSLNADGRLSDGAGGFQKLEGQRKVVNFLQFNHVQAPGAEISWNEVVNTPYQSLVEDNLNMYVSGGSLAKPILIHDNYIQGAYNIDPASSMPFYGGGILLGDGPTERAEQSAHIRVYNNQLVGTVNYGIGIVGGTDMRMYNNRVVSSGLLPDGRPLGFSNVGMMVWNYAGSVPELFGDNSVSDNYVGFTNRNADGTVRGNNVWWLPDCSAAYRSTCTNNTAVHDVTLDAEKAEWTSWLAKLATNNVTPGSAR